MGLARRIRSYYLFDSFQGLPPVQNIDGPQAAAWQADVDSPTHHNNCSAPIESAQTAMQMSGAKDVSIIKGWFKETLPNFAPPGPIALPRLDGDWYDSTLLSLKYLYHLVAEDGLVVVDDYYAWDGCARALQAPPPTGESSNLTMKSACSRPIDFGSTHSAV